MVFGPRGWIGSSNSPQRYGALNVGGGEIPGGLSNNSQIPRIIQLQVRIHGVLLGLYI